MHSHGRTLIAKLGFADPDKGDARHDAACRYLAQPANHAAVVGNFIWGALPNAPDFPRGCTPAYEVPFQKNAGFVDLKLPFAREAREDDGEVKAAVHWVECQIKLRREEPERWEKLKRACKGMALVDEGNERYFRCSPYVIRWLNVEVKVFPVPIGAILRQINFYRSHVGGPWLLATLFPLTRGDHEVLEGADISHVLLGESFHRWAAEEQVKELTLPPVQTLVL